MKESAMIKKITRRIKSFFVPTTQNDMHPGGLSRVAFLLYLFLGLILATSSIYITTSRLATPIDIASFQPSQIFTLLNTARDTADLKPLTENAQLYQAALKKARDMLARQYFSHTTPDNEEPWVFVQEAEYMYSAAGENLAIDFLTAQAAHSALMQSPTHRANILNVSYEEVGIAVVPGNFEGRPSIIVVQFFGTPLIRQAIAANTPTIQNLSPDISQDINTNPNPPPKDTNPSSTDDQDGQAPEPIILEEQ